MMRLLSFLFALILFVAPALAAEANLPYKKGEVVRFAIKKMGIKAGEATLTFEGLVEVKDQQAYLIVFKADGFNFYDEEKIYVHPETFAPIMVMRDLNIFGSKEKITEEYFPEEGKIVISKVTGERTTREEIKKDGQIDNIYGAIYRYRAFGAFIPNDQVDLRLPTRDVALKLINSLQLKVAGKMFDAFYMASDPSKYQVWFDAGPNKIPLRITGAVGMANTTMFMTSYSEGSM